MAGLLRELIPSKTTVATCIIMYGYIRLRAHYPDSVRVLHKLVELALNTFLHALIAFVFVLLVIVPLLSALLGDDDDENSDAAPASVRLPPNDEESLVPSSESEPQGGPEEELSRGVRGFLEQLGNNAFFAGLAFFAAWVLRPTGASILGGTFQVLMTVAGYTTVAILCPSLIVSAPLLIIWVMVRRLTVEPHKSSWYRAIRVCTRITAGIFAYLLVIETITFYQPPLLEPVIAHLAWQAELLSAPSKYFLDRALLKLSLEPIPPAAPRRGYDSLVLVAQYIILPIGMICNGYICSASLALDGLVSAAIVIAWITVGVLALFVLDVLVYWAYFFWAGRQRSQSESTTASDAQAGRSSPIDTMAIALFAFTIRDATGKTPWPMRKSEPGEEGAPTSELETQKTDATVGECDSEKGGRESEAP
ncbi:hypothetical protein FB451DRAFT_1371091 [Mycena latifolia]|nr:hypothetical protein FB451DRAFT_1371091 [Mycena latifolia]